MSQRLRAKNITSDKLQQKYPSDLNYSDFQLARPQHPVKHLARHLH